MAKDLAPADKDNQVSLSESETDDDEEEHGSDIVQCEIACMRKQRTFLRLRNEVRELRLGAVAHCRTNCR